MNYKKVTLGLVGRPSVAPDCGDSLEMLKQDVCKHKLLTAQQQVSAFLHACCLFSLYCKWLDVIFLYKRRCFHFLSTLKNKQTNKKLKTIKQSPWGGNMKSSEKQSRDEKGSKKEKPSKYEEWVWFFLLLIRFWYDSMNTALFAHFSFFIIISK